MTSELVKQLRVGRSSGAVLKARLSQIRARNRTVPVFIYEGVDDVGPYAAWISRIDGDFLYEPLPGNGKGQVLNLRSRLQHDRGGLGSAVYFFVDRDFDELRGQPAGPDIYCTQAYSIENYLVTDRVMNALLTDEFRCTADTDDRNAALALFRDVMTQFAATMHEPNRRLFRARKLGIRGKGNVTDAIGKYVEISLHSVGVLYTNDSLKDLIPLDREPTAEESLSVDQEFSQLTPPTRHRGKYFLAFFLRWLELLASERRDGTTGLFSSTLDLKFTPQKLSLKALALHAHVPEGLAGFIGAAKQSAA